MPPVIKIDNLSKAYQLGEIGTGTLSRDLERYWARIRGKEDPFLKIGEVNDRSKKGDSDIVWSLKDIHFDIEQGDALGIIGRNGAGKSTLLKILSRVTAPTTGSVKIKGRIASLLEVGTGFHPELSGRENIYLNGAILGMRKAEIKRKFDEIVDFSGVERYVDTPVKRYSSGMYVRLAFAVAAHLESEILIVDEVLAVGDAEFQKKCLGKMGDVSKGEGRTILFVSHNMAAIQKLCKHGMLLENGKLICIDKTENVIDRYLQDSRIKKAVFEIPLPDNADELIGYASQIQIENANGDVIQEIPVGQFWQIRVFFKINKKAEHFIIGMGINNFIDVNIRTSWSVKMDLEEGCYQAIFKETDLILAPGNYNVTIGLSNYERPIHYLENAASFMISEVTDAFMDSSIIRTNNVGLILNPMQVAISSLQ
ncbi:ABC transporter ATP-binding protein [Mucilaginibacter ginsenosidivorax]|uniref:ABC transporter ATP-binding protein n=1 Tax=Mucilaginibacter ginsenosidivorax TaxID=862126 RepID=A0A5B8W4S4_9SPHI|nr:ABC transporter ATP-binding protein [Mucilaginibacter ginsenosidivorax]QEC77932.1 ABC transporter ATP-binding protein [Mucilaginibacter ginsenosidivorax]